MSQVWRDVLTAYYRKQGYNFMTPKVLDYRVNEDKNAVIELSEGTDFDHKPLFGVSVFVFDDKGQRLFGEEDKNPHKGCYSSRKEAKKHYECA